MPRTLRALVVSLSLLAPALLADAAAASPALSALETFRAGHGRVVEKVAARAPDDAIQREVDALLDFGGLARESLGGPEKFAERCAPRCADFEALLTRLIRENYLRRLRNERQHRVEYLGEEPRARGVLVKTLVTYSKDGKDDSVAVDYLMHDDGERWRVHDIITDGVSLARNYKYEFGQILKKDGIDGLIARLEAKLALLARKD